MENLRFGIVGAGMIAGVIADAIARSSKAELKAVSSRRKETAVAFVADRPGVAAAEGLEDMLRQVDAVYIATPTVPKEEIALAAIAAGKHVLVDKPFVDRPSVARMSSAAAAKGVAFMDATHFVHHPRTAAVRAAIPGRIGTPRSLHTAFYFPFSDKTNIRFNPQVEPMTALGDMAWYSMRAVVEYLRPAGPVKSAAVVAERDPETNAIVRASGTIAFDGGESSTFDVGYTAGTLVMDLSLLGTSGVLGMDDFVLDWANSYPFKAPDVPVGYTVRSGLATRNDVEFVATPSETPQEVAMIDAFAEIAATPDAPRRIAFIEASLRTQSYLDALWAAANA